MGGFSVIAVRLFAHRGLFMKKTGGVEPKMQVPVYVTVIIAVVVLLAGLIVGGVAGYQRRKAAAERTP